jgi:ribosomal protein S18 acetylase RimI-like enzyme
MILNLCSNYFPNQMNLETYEIAKLKKGEALPFDLLLLADETKEAIEKYIHSSDVYVVRETEMKAPIASFVLYPVNKDRLEIKNIAVAESLQSKGLGSLLLHQIELIARNACYREILVGTPDVALPQIHFYEKNGYVKFELKTGFYTTNYPEPIIENGALLKDMQMLLKVIAI